MMCYKKLSLLSLRSRVTEYIMFVILLSGIGMGGMLLSFAGVTTTSTNKPVDSSAKTLPTPQVKQPEQSKTTEVKPEAVGLQGPETKTKTENENKTETKNENKTDNKMETKTESNIAMKENRAGARELPESPLNDSISFVKYVMSLVFVLGLIFLSAYLYKKLVGIKSTGLRRNMVPMNIVGTMSLGDKKFLVIVEIQGKHYFLGVTASSINFLSSLELDLSQVNRDEVSGNDFEAFLSRARALLQNRGKK